MRLESFRLVPCVSLRNWYIGYNIPLLHTIHRHWDAVRIWSDCRRTDCGSCRDQQAAGPCSAFGCSCRAKEKDVGSVDLRKRFQPVRHSLRSKSKPMSEALLDYSWACTAYRKHYRNWNIKIRGWSRALDCWWKPANGEPLRALLYSSRTCPRSRQSHWE